MPRGENCRDSHVLHDGPVGAGRSQRVATSCHAAGGPVSAYTVVADPLWVADQAGSFATWPPDAISAGWGARAGAGEGAPRCTPQNRPDWP